MVKVLSPPNHRLNFNKNVNRMDLTTHQSYEPMMVQTQMTHTDPTYFIPEMSKKYSDPPYVYKHIYVTSPEVTTPAEKKRKKKKKIQNKDDSWMEYLNPFGCDSDDDYDDDEYSYYTGSEEHSTKKKSKVKPKKKKKKILVKLLFAAALLFAAKCIITQLCYYFPNLFPTTGRDELYDHEDQLYHDGIDFERAGDHGKAQEIAKKYQSVFSPNFDETKIAHATFEKIKSPGKLPPSLKKNKRKRSTNFSFA